MHILGYQSPFPVAGMVRKAIVPAAFVGALSGCARSDLTAPVAGRFSKIVLLEGLFEPMELDVLPDARILFVQRRGEVLLHDPTTQATDTLAVLQVFTGFEEGLLGVAVDPQFVRTRWVYFTYSAAQDPVIRVARFTVDQKRLDLASEKVLLEIAVQRKECCHVGGSLEFGPGENLFISVGDHTNPFASDGFAPIDEREGRSPWDAQATAANTMDLRGKILRIRPEHDGTYSIPVGNLFAADASIGRPEIYVMGNRNPFRISIDARSGYLYWGEVGPDAGDSSAVCGPKGHDEVNQARRAGNFGWPHFVGNNKAYHDFDFATGESGAPFDARAPLNDSPNNTGLQVLPAAQSALIWYPYDQSTAFPAVGDGGRNAMAGLVYYIMNYIRSDNRFPLYYDENLFTYDGMRDWVSVVTLGPSGAYVSMERILPNIAFSSPVDMLFGPEGALYLLEYGSVWYAQNADARLSRIDYAVRNRPPMARIAVSEAFGAAPHSGTLSAALSRDPDGDALTYRWQIHKRRARGDTATFAFSEAGIYHVLLSATDSRGLAGQDSMDILVGNEVPGVKVHIHGNRTFYWPGKTIAYSVSDLEDGALNQGIRPEQVAFTADPVAEGFDLTAQAGHHMAVLESAGFLAGRPLVERHNCAACHHARDASVGPSFAAIKARYAAVDTTGTYLADRIVQGGGGAWGDRAMAAHPQIPRSEALKMVQFIPADEVAGKRPLAGTLVPDRNRGRYMLMASYTDAGMPPLTGHDIVVMRPQRLEAEDFDEAEALEVVDPPEGETGLVVGSDGAYFAFRSLDLTGIGSFRIRAAAQSAPAERSLEIRAHSRDGFRYGTVEIEHGIRAYDVVIDANGSTTDLYFIFVGPSFAVDWVEARK